MAENNDPVAKDGHEEEEAYILVEFSGVIDEDFLLKEKKTCKILGLETDSPVLQLDEYIFAGDYEDVVGTSVLFEEKVNPNGKENILSFGYLCERKLNMKRAFLKDKPSEMVEVLVQESGYDFSSTGQEDDSIDTEAVEDEEEEIIVPDQI